MAVNRDFTKTLIERLTNAKYEGGGSTGRPVRVTPGEDGHVWKRTGPTTSGADRHRQWLFDNITFPPPPMPGFLHDHAQALEREEDGHPKAPVHGPGKNKVKTILDAAKHADLQLIPDPASSGTADTENVYGILREKIRLEAARFVRECAKDLQNTFQGETVRPNDLTSAAETYIKHWQNQEEQDWY